MSLWYPENYCTRYGERCQPPYDGPPHYPAVPALRVIDLAARRLRHKRAVFWRTARAWALGQWETGGFVFSIVETLGAEAYTAGTITINVTDTHDGTAGQADFGAWPEYPTVPEAEIPNPGSAWAHVDDEWFNGMFRAGMKVPMQRVLAHELGHTFGFGHNPATGIMHSPVTGNVSAEEIAAARAYWF